MDSDTIVQAAVGGGLLLAGLWNGWETYQTKRLAREQAHKVRETHQQVAVNGHVSASPTLLDKIDTLGGDAREARQAAADAAVAAKALGSMLEGHLERSAEDRANLWAHVHGAEAQIAVILDRQEGPPR